MFNDIVCDGICVCKIPRNPVLAGGYAQRTHNPGLIGLKYLELGGQRGGPGGNRERESRGHPEVAGRGGVDLTRAAQP